MSDVIKTGKVVIDFVKGKSDVAPPSMKPVEEARRREISLVEEVLAQEEKVRQAQAAASAEAEAQVAKQIAARRQQLEIINNVAEGVLRMGRAFALAAASGTGEIRELVQAMVAAQVATDIYLGMTKAIQGLVAWLGAARIATLGLTGAIALLESVAAPLIIVLAALAAIYVVVAGNAKAAAEEAEKQSELARQTLEDVVAANAKAAQSRNDLNKAYRETLTLAQQAAAIDAQRPEEQVRYAAEMSEKYGTNSGIDPQEQQKALAENAVNLLKEREDVQRRITAEQIKALDYQAELVQSKQKELDLASETLKTEEAKTQAFLAQFGALSKGEQERLKRIDKKINAGQDLTRSELAALGRAGGLAGEAAARIYAEKGRQAGGDQLLFGGKDNVAAATKRVQDAAGELSQVTGGLTTDQALRAIQARKNEVEKEFAKFLETNSTALRSAVTTLLEITERIKKIEVAYAKVRGR